MNEDMFGFQYEDDEDSEVKGCFSGGSNVGGRKWW